MRKLTTKIIADMLMIKNTEFTIKVQELHSKLLEENAMICKCYDLIIRFPNLQISKDFTGMWTPEVNHLVNYVNVKEKRDDFSYCCYMYPFVFINSTKIHGVIKSKYYKKSDEYVPFLLSSNGLECKGWQDDLRKQKITEFIIKETESQLYEIIKKQ